MVRLLAFTQVEVWSPGKVLSRGGRALTCILKRFLCGLRSLSSSSLRALGRAGTGPEAVGCALCSNFCVSSGGQLHRAF